MPLVRIVETRDLSDAERGAIRRLLDQAFEGGFSDDDWLHALGGWPAVTRAATDLVRERFDLGALSTGKWGFYARFGWERWRGPTYVRLVDGRLRRSADEDDSVMILRCPASQDIDVSAGITCDEREGDSW